MSKIDLLQGDCLELMKTYALEVKVNDYAYGVWFKVIDLNDDEVEIYDHLFEVNQTFTKDSQMVFRGVETK